MVCQGSSSLEIARFAVRVLAVSPHPDDDVIGAGGSLALHAKAGHEVSTVHVVGRERASTDHARTDAQLRREVELANAALGVSRCVELDAPSRDLTPTRALRLGLVTVLREVRPDVVYIPHADEVDQEHALVHHLALDALWMAASPFFEEAPGEPIGGPELVLGYEVWTPMRRFQHVQEISETIDVKSEAMAHYHSQTENADWVAAIRGLSAYRGTITKGRGFAEVFTVETVGSQGLSERLRLPA
jgi:LmbE family N-acetylglucosaminyl deacetylase